jgi:acetyl-CoA/propionyl-CoA carboxylase biotin carboxyl carrier protein
MPDESLTPREVATQLGVTTRTVQRWIADGRLPAERVGSRVRVSRSSLARVASGGPQGAGPRIQTLLVANRGEIAVRIARTARGMGIRTVGVHRPDERQPDGFDEVLPIGSYLDGDELIAVARRTRADAIHPGYGFLAENPTFAAAVEGAGLVWVGPGSHAISALGDKAAARRLVAERGVPVLPGYDSSEQTDAALAREAAALGFPLLVKPAAGGGGKGMHVVLRADDLGDALAASRREAARAFGDDRLILERYQRGARHIEVQILFDREGASVHLGERDCSTQRRSQKVIEEAPGPSVTPSLRERLGDAALTAAAAVGYVNAGTVEFLVTDDGSFAFLEMNARLQVEHPVTEAVTGRDLVADQLRIAAGEGLGMRQSDVRLHGHAIEARLYAEDAEAGFLPSTGRVALLRWPPGARVDTALQVDDEVTDRYDPMLAKVIVHAQSRAVALAGLRQALAATTVLGLTTNLRYLRWLARTDAIDAGEMRTDTLEGLDGPAAARASDIHWHAAARALADQLPPGAWGGGWRLNAAPSVRLACGDEQRTVVVDEQRTVVVPAEGLGATLVVDAATAHVDVEGRSMPFAIAPPPSIDDAVRHAVAGEGGASVLVAPMPGRVVAVRTAPGNSVEAGATLIVIEAMKMEHSVVAPMPGTVSSVHVVEGQQVQRGELLAEIAAYHANDA